MKKATGAGVLYLPGSSECFERDLSLVSGSLVLDAFSTEMTKLMFGALGGPVKGVLKKIGLAGLETLVNEMSTGDGSLDEDELIAKISSVLGTLTPDQVKLLLPIARDLVTKKIGNTIGAGRLVSAKSKSPSPNAGSQTSCEFYVTASVSGNIIEKYSDFTIYGTCEMDCIPGGKLKCPCGCNAKFNVWIEGTRGGFGKLPTISRKRFESL
jgi:hypothetical protein